jgi:DNA-binding transcriptional MerR regulator
MRLKAFCEATGLSRDTVNFYVRLGLITPSSSGSSSNSYRDFDDDQIGAARMISQAKALGFSLGEIGRMAQRYRVEKPDRDALIALLQEQLDRLDERRAALDAMENTLRTKLEGLGATFAVRKISV